jgi:DNA polymerase-1
MYRERVKNINAKKKTLSKRTHAEELVKLDIEKDKENTTLKEIKIQISDLTEENADLKEAIRDSKEVLADTKDMSFEDIEVPTMMLYAAIDTDITRRISKQQIAEIKKDSTALFKVLGTVMLPAAKVLGEMEHVGIRIDLDYLEELKKHFEKIIEENKAKVYQKIGREINLNSARSIIDVLTADFGVKLTKKTKSGQYSTDAAVMEELAKEHEIAQLILDYKKAYKARHTFLEGIMNGGKGKHDYGCSIDGRIHGNYNQTVAATGRLSSSAPNMQNIPLYILDMNIKKLFVPDDPETQVMVQVDASAAEVRVMTAYAPDPELIKVLNQGLDTHSFVGSEVFAAKGIHNTPGVTYDELKNREQHIKTNPKEYERLDTMRQIAKMVMFLTIYGGGAFTLQGNLEKAGTILTIEQCEEIIAMLLKKFPAIKKYMRTIQNTVNAKGEVQTYFGRKRRFPIARFSYKMKKAAYREAINSPIQGTSSDIILHQMVEVHKVFAELGFKRVLRGTVHDSVFFQFPKSELHRLIPLLDVHFRDNVNVHFPWMKVKFEYDVEFGPSYGEAKTNLKKADFQKTA